ncbi:glucan endo-1,3-beta-glucosidase 1 [Malania oleifera]|uniref:glucan endo-1,3-beta-glucosidase 1 n=1 Tax=Malania oleifera TaxID=397392 RepID=UPI0025AE01F3|nr:glucan endo-1,3-beta-glucosidase 1 [Malania oleifera]
MWKKVGWLSHLFSLSLLTFAAGTGQESFELLHVCDPSTPGALQAMSNAGLPLAVSVSNSDLREVSRSVLLAESWVRTHVLAHFPSTQITAIVVGNAYLLCNTNQEHQLGLVLPSLKNIFHSLTRWGLQREITVSAALSSECFPPKSSSLGNDLTDRILKPLLKFLQDTNSTYSVNPPPDSPHSSGDETVRLVSSHKEFVKELGFYELNRIAVLVPGAKERKPKSRKLSVMSSLLVDSLPARPKPLPEFPPSTAQPSYGYPAPPNVANNPFPPLPQTASPPPSALPPLVSPSNPPYGLALPPCNPFAAAAPVPMTKVEEGLWCVAKPSVPAETLQEAMDFACGEGGADCKEIRPHGSCYNPDSLVSHASYAFNSYWQKNKRNGGTCNFGGTAMMITSDPSSVHCRFILN